MVTIPAEPKSNVSVGVPAVVPGSEGSPVPPPADPPGAGCANVFVEKKQTIIKDNTIVKKFFFIG